MMLRSRNLSGNRCSLRILRWEPSNLARLVCTEHNSSFHMGRSSVHCLRLLSIGRLFYAPPQDVRYEMSLRNWGICKASRFLKEFALVNRLQAL